jgi:uncharacterized protein YeaO (DUF488 family)
MQALGKRFDQDEILKIMGYEIRLPRSKRADILSEVLMSKRLSARSIRLKRAYESPAGDDGTRILVDRLWPRGVKKADAAIDRWAKDLAPSTTLRKWFGHDASRWPEFRRRYTEELRGQTARLRELRALARQNPITLVYSAHDELHNDAVVLREVLLGR